MAGEWFQGQVPRNENFSQKKQKQVCTAADRGDDQESNTSDQQAAAKKPIFTPSELANCKITVQQAKADSMRGKAIFIDVRPASEYEAVHIEPSMNISEHTLATRTFLKNRPFIIVDKGYRTYNLAELCVTLKKKGFGKVSVMNGGITSWIQAGHAVYQKDISAVRDVFIISPRQMVSTAGRQKWTIAGIGPETDRINKMFSSENIINIANKMANTKKENSVVNDTFFNPTLIIGAEGYDVNLTRSLVQKGLTPVFYLDGGIDNYLEYRRILRRKVEHSAVALGSIAKCPGS